MLVKVRTSVALCTFNGEKYLPQQLASIFQQEQAVDEVIVCDDGSSDETLSILESYQRDFPQAMKIFRNERNLGARRNFEKCFSLCTGDVIFFADQDDVWHTEKVQKTLAVFANDEACLAIATDACLIGEDGEDLHKGFWESFLFCAANSGTLFKEGLHEFVIKHHNVVAGAMLAVKKEAKPYLLPFRFPNNIWHDEWITIVLSCMGRMKLLDEKLVLYRSHSGQQMGVGSQSADLQSWVKTLRSEEILRSNPDFYLTHAWQSYQKTKQLQAGLPFLNLQPLSSLLYGRLQDAKRTFLNRQNFMARKGRLLKWCMEGRYATDWKEVITL